MRYRDILFSKNSIFFSVIFIILIHFFLGNFDYKVVPDTQSYIDATIINDANNSKRTPIFGLFLKALPSQYQYLPIFHFSFLFASIYFFCKTLNLLGFSSKFNLFVFIVFGLSNISLFYMPYVHPEIIANSLLLFGISIALRYANKERISFLQILVFGFFELIIILFKPSFILCILLLPLIYFFSKRAINGFDSNKKIFKNTIILIFSGIVFFVSYSALRYTVHNDFHIVSYGGYNIVGLSATLLEKDTIPKLQPNHQELAERIVEKKEQFFRDKKLVNYHGMSSVLSSKDSMLIGYFDIAARNYDVLSDIGKLSLQTDSWVEFNSKMQSFSIDVIFSEPLSYSLYVVGALSRFVGKSLVTNFSFLFFLSIFVIYFILKKSITLKTEKENFEYYILILIALFFFFINLVPSIIVSFPAQRYIDAGGFGLGLIPSFLIFSILNKIFDDSK